MLVKEREEILQILEIIELFIDGKIKDLPKFPYSKDIIDSDVFFKLNIVYNKIIKNEEKKNENLEDFAKSDAIMENIKNMIKEELEYSKKKQMKDKNETIVLTEELLNTQKKFRNKKSSNYDIATRKRFYA